jgi:hypothetical protein
MNKRFLSAGSAMAILVSLATIPQEAAAACGSSEFPGCGACQRSFAAAEWTRFGCSSCGGICYSFAGVKPGEAKIVKAVADKATERGRVTEGNFIQADPAILVQLAQVNPMAAMVVQAFSPWEEPVYASIKEGRIANRRIPTLENVMLTLRNNRDEAAFSAAMKPIADSNHFAEVRWNSSLTASGDLEVTFESHLITADGAATQQKLYPTVKAVFSKSTPVRLLSWKTQD